MTVLANPMYGLKPKLIEGRMRGQRVAWMDCHVIPTLKGLLTVDTIVTNMSHLRQDGQECRRRQGVLRKEAGNLTHPELRNFALLNLVVWRK